MATTTFTVTNLNPDFEFPNGFWFDPRNDGGIDLNTDDDGTDDVVVAPNGVTTNDSRGVWVWVDGQTFDIDGSSSVVGTQANILKNALQSRTFAWTPHNPDYDTVAPYLKDGTTENPNFDNSGNPISMWDLQPNYGFGTANKAFMAGDICKHFSIVVAIA